MMSFSLQKLMTTLLGLTLGLTFGTTFAASSALAETVVPAPSLQQTKISVNSNMARILRLNSPAATVIIGNPAIADVTVQDAKTLILTGKSFGQTNVIILNAKGDPIADTLVEVVQQQADTITLYVGAEKRSMACNPECLPTIMLGDDPNYTSTVIDASRSLADSAR